MNILNKLFPPAPDYLGIVQHRLDKKLPDCEVEFRPVVTSPHDVKIAERILQAFYKAQADEIRTVTGDIWDRIQARQEDFYQIYKNPMAVADYLNHMNYKSITIGISPTGLQDIKDMDGSKKLRQQWGIRIKEELVMFAEALGVLPYNLAGDALYADADEILKRVGVKLATAIRPADFEGGMYALKIEGKYFNYHEFNLVYYAWKMKKIVGNKPIGEIGGGMGKVAMYAHDLGLTDYTMYDLPIINLLQAWFLIKTGIPVSLYGEEREGVQVLPYWEFGKKNFELTLNTNAFPEMDVSIVRKYLEAIKLNSKYLLSINQEDSRPYGNGRKHVVVKDVVASVGGFKRISRTPSWFRSSYPEELYVTR